MPPGWHMASVVAVVLVANALIFLHPLKAFFGKHARWLHWPAFSSNSRRSSSVDPCGHASGHGSSWEHADPDDLVGTNAKTVVSCMVSYILNPPKHCLLPCQFSPYVTWYDSQPYPDVKALPALPAPAVPRPTRQAGAALPTSGYTGVLLSDTAVGVCGPKVLRLS